MNGDLTDTIAAPATPRGRSALSVVRLDGPESLRIVESLTEGLTLEPRRATRATLRDADGNVLDDAVVTWFRAPHSYTGNDLVEISLHGNPLLSDGVIREALRLGARIAEPGEFTERAVLNGKIDLLQAEAIAALANARTAVQAKLSLRILGGATSMLAGKIRDQLLAIMSRLEAALDFADEGYEFISREEASGQLGDILEKLEALHASYEKGRVTTDGLTAVILGRPNAGKSSLLNFLVGSERAIVTEIPGTTRDLLRETVALGGLPVTFVDTAGLRETGDHVERIGIDRARSAAAQADLVLYVIDASRGRTVADEQELAALGETSVLVIYSKVDLAAPPAGELGVSTREGLGTTELLARLDGLVRERFVPPDESVPLVTARQRRAVEEAVVAIRSARSAVDAGSNEEVIAVDLQTASSALTSLIGAIGREDLYSEIFAKFCIGK